MMFLITSILPIHILISQSSKELEVVFFADFTQSLPWREGRGYNLELLKNIIDEVHYFANPENMAYGEKFSFYIIATSFSHPVYIGYSSKPSKRKAHKECGKHPYLSRRCGGCRAGCFISLNNKFVKFSSARKSSRKGKFAPSLFIKQTFGNSVSWDKFIEFFLSRKDYGSPISNAVIKACSMARANRNKDYIFIFYSDMIEEAPGNKLTRIKENQISSKCRNLTNATFYVVEDIRVVGNRERYLDTYRNQWKSLFERLNVKFSILNMDEIEERVNERISGGS